MEDDVLERCRQGDRAAHGELFELYHRHVYNLALHFSADEALAADVTQEVFLKLFDRLGQFRRDAEFSTWLYRVVLNTFLDLRRRGRNWLSLGLLEDEPPRPEWVLEPPQAEAVERAEQQRLVRRAIARLPVHLRAPVALRYAAGLGYEEIAAVLEIAPGTVASRLNRAHRKLARKLAPLRERHRGPVCYTPADARADR